MKTMEAALVLVLFVSLSCAERKVPRADVTGYVDHKRMGFHKFHPELTPSWERARALCEEEGAHLTVVNSKEEAAVLKDMFIPYPDTKHDFAYIDFNDLVRENTFVTTDGTPISKAGYNIFKNGEPNNNQGGEKNPGEDCGSLYREGTFNDVPCFVDKPFICEI